MKATARSKKQKPPYRGSIEVAVGSSVVRVKLPPAADYEIGARTTAEGSYKGRPFTVPLVRIEGGWDVRDRA